MSSASIEPAQAKISGQHSPKKIVLRSGSTVVEKRGILNGNSVLEARRESVTNNDQDEMANLREEILKQKQQLETFKVKLKREEESKKHW